ncbi:MAG: redoxin domain-containing protein [Bacteroidota bacterium]
MEIGPIQHISRLCIWLSLILLIGQSCQVPFSQSPPSDHARQDDQQVFDQLYLDDQILAGNFLNANVHPEYANITQRLTRFVQDNRLSKTMAQSTAFRVMLLHHYHKGHYLFLDSLDQWLERGFISQEGYQEYKGYVVDDPTMIEAMNSRRTVRPKIEATAMPLYQLGNELITAELYLGDEVQRQVQTWRIYDDYFYLVDWDQNGRFTDVGTDLIGADKLKAWPPEFRPLPSRTILKTARQTIAFTPSENLSHSFDLALAEDSVDLELIAQLPDCLALQNPALDNALTAALNTSDPMVLYFWATWCKPCVKKIKQLALTDFQADGRRYIPICVQSSLNSLEALQANHKLDFPPFLLADAEAKALGIYQVPTTLFLDQEKRAIRRE